MYVLPAGFLKPVTEFLPAMHAQTRTRRHFILDHIGYSLAIFGEIQFAPAGHAQSQAFRCYSIIIPRAGTTSTQLQARAQAPPGLN